jgi:hypothetical protein
MIGYASGVYYFLTLALCEFFTYCQARGLSVYTSPGGECSTFFLIYPPY